MDCMLVYSKKIVQFISDIRNTIKIVLAKEIGLKVAGDRFYNEKQDASFPIRVVIYNNKSMLGYFDPHFYELGFHEYLMHSSRNQLHNIIQHELAHYMTFIIHGETLHPHGEEFKNFCKKMKWSEDVYASTTCLDGGKEIAEIQESGVLRKVQKLMALTNSSNTNEAEQAMIKSQELLLKHNIESKYIGEEDEEKVFLKRIIKQKKENAKMQSIGTILKTFFVSVVYRRTEEYTYLEILGTAVNIEIAEYVAQFLDSELDILWKKAKTFNLKGQLAKNSFLLGIAKGYSDKIQALKREYSQEVTTALIEIENKLMLAQEMAYKRLTNASRRRSFCRSASELGEIMGKHLNIHPAINKSNSKTAYLALEYRN